MRNKVTIVGLGYIGLPTAAVMAESGMQVCGYDLNTRVVEALNKGEIIIEEPGLEDLVKKVVREGRLRGVSELEESDVFIISVPTPINEDKTADMSYVKSAAKAVAEVVKKGNAVVLESTSPPGATEEIVAEALKAAGLEIGSDIFVAHSPERVLPGRILIELVENDRIIGGINKESTEVVKEIYQRFVKGNIFTTDSRTAEMCKLMENTYRDVNIALANELAVLSEKMGINAWDVIRLANKHPRVNLHQPGPGVGGHCIAVDPWFVIEGQSEGKLIRQARERNDGMPEYVHKTIKRLVGGLEDPKVAILGVTYKPDVDDTRESPIMKLVSSLIDEGKINVRIHDPHVDDKIFKYLHLKRESVIEAVRDADLIVLAVNHSEYKELNFEEIGNAMRNKLIYDTRNFLDVSGLEIQGFRVHLLGRG
jgi:UDP-N-acetyl-D-mannosaminuronic acid dehydrogenase